MKDKRRVDIKKKRTWQWVGESSFLYKFDDLGESRDIDEGFDDVSSRKGIDDLVNDVDDRVAELNFVVGTTDGSPVDSDNLEETW